MRRGSKGLAQVSPGIERKSRVFVDFKKLNRNLKAGLQHAIIEPELGLYDGLFLL